MISLPEIIETMLRDPLKNEVPLKINGKKVHYIANKFIGVQWCCMFYIGGRI
jgi:hypothetical protein